MSSDEDDGLVRFGTPLDPIEEDEVPAKRITLADQIAVDSNGRRRFHGAFTGGFAAGYWNTVGSKEGWQPAEFKSSRQEKAAQRVQRASDFMDDEDVGEFGIAPQRIQTTDDFGPAQSESKGKRKAAPSKGPIPGVPVLELVLESFRDKAAVRLLRRMDDKYAKSYLNKLKQKREAKAEAAREKERQLAEQQATAETTEAAEMAEQQSDDVDVDAESAKVYQCDMGPIARLPVADADSDTDTDIDDTDDVVFDEDEFDAIFRNMKIDRFGLNYAGLEKGNFFSIVGAEAPVRQTAPLTSFTMLDKNNKSVTIRGQAFGVGAFEEDDDDIYGRDDMAKYDFQLSNRQAKSGSRQELNRAQQFIDGFEKSSTTIAQKQAKPVFRVHVPSAFEPRDWLKRKSRFGPEVVASTSKGAGAKVVGRHDMTPAQRGDILNQRKTKAANTEPDLVWLAPSEAVPTQPDTIEVAQSPFKSKPFVIPDSIPNIFDRFTSSNNDAKPDDKAKPVEKIEAPPAPETPKEVKKVTRTRFAWLPNQLLCYKMNMETAVGSKPEKSNTFSLFEFINVGSIAKRKNALEFEQSTHKDDTEEAEREKIHERSKEPANVPTIVSMPSVPAVHSNQLLNVQDERPLAIHRQTDEATAPKPLVRNVIKPKTELERKIVAAQDAHPSKKMDLFKAVFASDSESDEQDEAAADPFGDSKKELMASLGKPIASAATPSFRAHLPDNPFAPKSAKELNILRNTSPPRGIFRSLIDTSELLAKARAADAQRSGAEATPIAEHVNADKDAYGPSLPPAIAPLATVKQQSQASSSMQSDIHFADDWVERSSDRASKKSKKDKKEKHKEKKVKKDKHKSKKSKKDRHKEKRRH